MLPERRCPGRAVPDEARHGHRHGCARRPRARDPRVLEGRAGGTEAEYWGLSYRQGLEWILRHDGRGAIKVFLAGGLAEASAAILPRGERRRLVCVARRGEADYFLGNYRWHRGDYPHRHSVYAVRVGDAEIMSVYDLRYERWGLRRGRWGERSPRRSA